MKDHSTSIARLRQRMTEGLRAPHKISYDLNASEAEIRRDVLISRTMMRSDNSSRVRDSFELLCELARFADAQRTMDLNIGGGLVDSGLEGFIGPLVSPTVVGRLGTPTIAMRLGNDGTSASGIPAIDGIPATQMVAEDGESTDTDLPTSSRAVVSYTQAGQPISMTRRLLKQSGIDLPAEVANLTRLAHALGNQRLVLVGDNSGTGGLEPNGILNTAGVLTHAVTATYTNADDAAVQELLLSAGGDGRSFAAMCSPARHELLMTTPVETGVAAMMAARNSNSVTGYSLYGSDNGSGMPIGTDSNIPDANMIVGDFGKARIIVDTEVDMSFLRGNASDKVTVYSFEEVDVVIDQAKAFCVVSIA